LLYTAEPEDAGKRLDHLLHLRLPEYSRSRIQEWIKSGRVLVNGKAARASYGAHAGDAIEVEPADPPPLHAAAEEIPLRVLYEDDDVVAIDKPAGMAVHAGAGIVHRLDRFTSGVLLVAKNDAAHQKLAAQFAGRQVEKVYLALAQGVVKQETGRIDRPIARDPVRRTRMTTRLDEGRAAWSEYRVLRRFANATLLEVRIGTGRTHQIRAHLASIGHPVVGDTLYGAAGSSGLDRYFLHAHRIRFRRPSDGLEVEVVSPLAEELEEYLRVSFSGQIQGCWRLRGAATRFRFWRCTDVTGRRCPVRVAADGVGRYG
jgi:23S rRNA pseudouridine1911/1915/1917 synthase